MAGNRTKGKNYIMSVATYVKNKETKMYNFGFSINSDGTSHYFKGDVIITEEELNKAYPTP